MKFPESMSRTRGDTCIGLDAERAKSPAIGCYNTQAGWLSIAWTGGIPDFDIFGRYLT